MTNHDTPARRIRPATALCLLLAGTVFVNISRMTLVPEDWNLPYNVTLAIYALGLAVATGLSTQDLGLQRCRVRSGLRVGGLAFAAVTAVVVAAGFLGLVSDGRADIAGPEMLLRILVLIPVGTVVVEELLFRSVLHGLLRRMLSIGWASAAGAVLFGLWHVYPTLHGGAISPADVDIDASMVVAGTFLTTCAAGGLFVWLRERSGSVVAPMLAHLATNSVTFLVAWITSGR